MGGLVCHTLEFGFHFKVVGATERLKQEKCILEPCASQHGEEIQGDYL